MKTNQELNKRQCRMCGLELPPFSRYDTDWCWMCWRETWECERHRYYVKSPESEKTGMGITYYEEVQSLRGLFAFSEENKPLIKKAMEAERKKLAKIK